MCLWKLFWFILMFIQYDRRGRSSRTGRRDMKDKRDERYMRDKRYKAKRASIWTFESQSWLSNIVFKLRIFENKTIFFFTLKLQGAGVIALLTIALRLRQKPPFNPICAGEVKYKGSPNQWFADSRFLSTRYVNWNKVFLLSWKAWRGQNKSKYTYVCEAWPHGGEAWIGKICK